MNIPYQVVFAEDVVLLYNYSYAVRDSDTKLIEQGQSSTMCSCVSDVYINVYQRRFNAPGSLPAELDASLLTSSLSNRGPEILVLPSKL